MHVASSVASTSLAVPPTQNTAPVLEFNCLYTHDIRRKSKRWQDGCLRFHTFNKRVMVYDVTRNLVGDAHWRESDLLQEGDEVKLDKNGVLVEVADQIGQTETDLTDLRKSKNKPTANPASSSPLRLLSAITIVNPTHPERRPLQSKHRSLNALLGPSRTPIGKAVLPTKSPYEIRKENAYPGESEEWAQQGRAKRQRVADTTAYGARAGNENNGAKAHAARNDETPARNIRKTNANMTPQSFSTPARDTSAAKKCRKEVVDLCSDDDRSDIFSSMLPDVAVPTPPRSEMPPPRLTSAAQRQTEPSTTGKRLSLAKTAPKRNMLACHSTVSDNPEARFQDAQKSKFEARLARLQERKNLRANQQQNTDHNRSRKESSTRQVPIAAPIEILSDSPTQKLEATHEDINDLMIEENTGISDAGLPAQHHTNTTLEADLVALDSVTFPGESYDLAEDEIEALDDMLIPDDDPEVEAELADTNFETESDVEAIDNVVIAEALDAQRTDFLVEDSTTVPQPLTLAVDSKTPNGQGDFLSGKDLDIDRSNEATAVASSDEQIHAVDQPQQHQSLAAQTNDRPCEHIIELPPDAPAVETVVPQAKLSALAQQQPFAPRKRRRVSRLKVRKSAASCFKPPTPATRNAVPTASKPGALEKQVSGDLVSTATSGPWSREAFDLFAWRPPDWDEDNWCLKA